MDFVLVEADFCQSVCVYGYVCVYRIMQLSLYVRVCVCACMCAYAYAYMRLCVHSNVRVCVLFFCFLIPTSRYKA